MGALGNQQYTIIYIQWRPSSQCHRAMALVVFLPRPEIWGIFWVPGNKKSQSPEVALVDFRPNGRPCSQTSASQAGPKFKTVCQRIRKNDLRYFKKICLLQYWYLVNVYMKILSCSNLLLHISFHQGKQCNDIYFLQTKIV